MQNGLEEVVALACDLGVDDGELSCLMRRVLDVGARQPEDGEGDKRVVGFVMELLSASTCTPRPGAVRERSDRQAAGRVGLTGGRW